MFREQNITANKKGEGFDEDDDEGKTWKECAIPPHFCINNIFPPKIHEVGNPSTMRNGYLLSVTTTSNLPKSTKSNKKLT